MLTVNDIHVYYGNIAAVKGISLTVYPGEIVTLIGGNGAGKSTTMRTISGLLKPEARRESLRGPAGVGSEGPRGGPARHRPEPGRSTDLPADDGRREPRTRRLHAQDKDGIATDMERVFELFPRLKERIAAEGRHALRRRAADAGDGSGADGQPRLLLLDEPSMGLAPVLVEVVFETIKKVNDQGTTVLLVEQNALVALNIADHAYVLETGHITLEGPAKPNWPTTTRSARPTSARGGHPRLCFCCWGRRRPVPRML